MQSELASALRLVGQELLRCRAAGITDGEWQGSQFKARVDMIADQCLRDALPRIADLPIVSEEDCVSQAGPRPREYWLIDPLDGTASFVHNFSGFVTQVALMREGRPWLAAAYAPALDRLYVAERGKGASLNGRRIAARAIDRQRLTLVDNYPEARGVAARLFHDLRCSRYLESGSIGLKICLVADGSADVFVKDVVVRDWDVAAPHLILDEAGGALTQFSGQSFEYSGDYQKCGLLAAASLALWRETEAITASYRLTPETS